MDVLADLSTALPYVVLGWILSWLVLKCFECEHKTRGEQEDGEEEEEEDDYSFLYELPDARRRRLVENYYRFYLVCKQCGDC
jgi:hypothetical protein